ncbi:hypothetical protein [Tolumonas lignilytica]|uniref:hypothetical protein n=1 Tax=Tolumonas lignilytica TaxID=1283284 RepID=UPI0004666AA8|nr:hypothetical protein [Tolumonas lignilytica]
MAEFSIKAKKTWFNKSHDEIIEEIRRQLDEQNVTDVDDNMIEKIAKDIEKELKIRAASKKTRLFAPLKLFMLLSILVTTISFSFLLIQGNNKFISKADTKTALHNALNKDISLDDLKLVYSKSTDNIANSIWVLLKPQYFYDKNKTNLNDVLQDIKIDIITQKEITSKEDGFLLTKINQYIQEYTKLNPLDGLNEQDKRDLKNIYSKLSADNYTLISDDLSSLTSSIKNKNDLINQYLNSSNLSLYISIAAFVFSVLITIWQLLPGRRISQKQIIAEAIKEHIKNNTSPS